MPGPLASTRHSRQGGKTNQQLIDTSISEWIFTFQYETQGGFAMDPQQVQKNIGQMRGIFAFFGGLNVLGIILNLVSGEPSGLIIISLVLAVIFFAAFDGLGKRTKTGRTFAQISSVIFLLGFPILTIFGISYLLKLSKPEMKEALSN